MSALNNTLHDYKDCPNTEVLKHLIDLREKASQDLHTMIGEFRGVGNTMKAFSNRIGEQEMRIDRHRTEVADIERNSAKALDEAQTALYEEIKSLRETIGTMHTELSQFNLHLRYGVVIVVGALILSPYIPKIGEKIAGWIF